MKKSTKIIIAVISVVVVAAAVVATLFFTGVIGTKKPQKGFYEYVEKLVANDESEASYGDYIAKLKKAQTNSSVSKSKMTMDVELGSTLKSEYGDIAELLNKVEINFDSKTDPSDKTTSGTMTLKYDGKDLLTFDVLADEDQVGIKIGDIYDKYLTVSLDDMMDMLEDSGIDLDDYNMSSITAENVNIEELIELLDISDGEINRIVNRYKDVLKKTIPEDNYSSKKEDITVNGKEIKATGYTVKISQKDVIELAKAMVDSLKDDDNTLDLVVDKVNKFVDIAGDSYSSMKISKREIVSLLEQVAASMSMVGGTSDEVLKITVYEYKNDTVRLAVEVEDNAFYIDTMKDGDKDTMEIKMKTDGKEMSLVKLEQTKKGEGKYNTKLSTDIEGVKFEISMDSEEDDNNSNVNLTMYVEIPSMIKATLKMESEVEFTSVKIDKITSSNSTKIDSIGEKELQELMTGLIDFIDDKMDVIEEIAGILGYEDQVKDFADDLKALKAPVTSNDMTTEQESEEEPAA